MNYRSPEPTAADRQQQADRYMRLSQPRNAEEHRAAALLAARIEAVLSVERTAS